MDQSRFGGNRLPMFLGFPENVSQIVGVDLEDYKLATPGTAAPPGMAKAIT